MKYWSVLDYLRLPKTDAKYHWKRLPRVFDYREVYNFFVSIEGKTMGGASEHRYLQGLDADLAKALTRIARRARKSPERLLNKVVHEYRKLLPDLQYVPYPRDVTQIIRSASQYE